MNLSANSSMKSHAVTVFKMCHFQHRSFLSLPCIRLINRILTHKTHKTKERWTNGVLKKWKIPPLYERDWITVNLMPLAKVFIMTLMTS